MKMRFESFQNLCKWMRMACDRERNEVYPTCRRPDRIPAGYSWGTCDKEHCPYYGVKITMGKGMLMDSSGKVLAEIESGSMVAVKEPEAPEDRRDENYVWIHGRIF